MLGYKITAAVMQSDPCSIQSETDGLVFQQVRHRPRPHSFSPLSLAVKTGQDSNGCLMSLIKTLVMTHPQRKCSMLQNTLWFIICELLTDGDQRLTDFRYVQGWAQGCWKWEVASNCQWWRPERHFCRQKRPTRGRSEENFYSFLLSAPALTWQEKQLLSLNRNVLFSAEIWLTLCWRVLRVRVDYITVMTSS